MRPAEVGICGIALASANRITGRRRNIGSSVGTPPHGTGFARLKRRNEMAKAKSANTNSASKSGDKSASTPQTKPNGSAKTNTTSKSSDIVSGVGLVGGAAAGAAAGTIFGPIGAAIGAVVGGVAGLNAREIAKELPSLGEVKTAIRGAAKKIKAEISAKKPAANKPAATKAQPKLTGAKKTTKKKPTTAKKK